MDSPGNPHRHAHGVTNRFTVPNTNHDAVPNSDPHAHSYGDLVSHTLSHTHGDLNSHTLSHTYGDLDGHTLAHAHRYRDGRGDCDGDDNANPVARCYGHGYAVHHADGDARIRVNSHGDCHRRSESDSHGNVDTDGHGNARRDMDASSDAHPNSYTHRFSHANADGLVRLPSIHCASQRQPLIAHGAAILAWIRPRVQHVRLRVDHDYLAAAELCSLFRSGHGHAVP